MTKFIRNFAIIAHIDHGKSTLADRLIEYCGGLQKREIGQQVLDSMVIEKERGITIKAQTVRLEYKAKNGNYYLLNLIDTPGHVDFAYEVSRSLASCEGSILVVDATQGVEAQTLANVYQALDHDHEIITAINKVDLSAANPTFVKKQIEEVIGIDTSNAILTSAKTGLGIIDLLEAIVHKLPEPGNKFFDKNRPDLLKALLIDSWYDKYLGVVILTRIFQGKITKGQRIKMLSTNASYNIENLGYFTPKKVVCEALEKDSIGFFTAAIKKVTDCKVGDTITNDTKTGVEPLPGFKVNLPVVFCGLYPEDASRFEDLKSALAKLQLNDSSLLFETENSIALGFGFRCGFLGLLHIEIVQERLEREFNLDLIITSPSVVYKAITTNNNTEIIVRNTSDFSFQNIKYILEPWVKATILVPESSLGSVIDLCNDKRGVQVEMKYSTSRIMLIYNIPLNEIVFDFYDKLKSLSKGYASFDWEMDYYKVSDLVKLFILVNGMVIDALSNIVHRSKAEIRGRELCSRLKDLIPRQLFQIAIQASINGRIIARENIKAIRKDVLAKCYGGDITRKRKLLEKQKAGKKKMRNVGAVEIPKSAFINALRIQK